MIIPTPMGRGVVAEVAQVVAPATKVVQVTVAAAVAVAAEEAAAAA